MAYTKKFSVTMVLRIQEAKTRRTSSKQETPCLMIIAAIIHKTNESKILIFKDYFTYQCDYFVWRNGRYDQAGKNANQSL